ncbi:type IX secretion system membrane protein PorP/SprF [Pedobacter hiemivivus]|uniref:Type IX secretion system membrane protein PorP/SprF n=1 Tax=Pedobacter hiemivivus TaxID=2530454 RepID=A0A4U1GKU6_9SPHI|nr:PorP/SprF family type IX secretion system membrane protein [Pedobacter hiemivivus]TKC65005.1 type IX secretion system membrane protein PorP/SprF [Pedobacter hiemivivus]
MKLYKQLLGVIAVCALFVNLGYAQLNPLSAQYYTNQYLANPAFAGAEQGLKLNGVYRKLWNNVPGSPLTQNLTTDYGFNKVGIGLTLNNESAGLQRQTRIVGTYAYHLKLNESNDQLHFGVSIGLMSQRLENADIYGNASDPMVRQYNDRKTYLDGDLGIAYTSGKLSLQAAVPNLKSVLKKDAIKLADVATFYAAASYMIKISEGADGMSMEPLVAYRGVKVFDNIWDAGAQLDIANKQVFLLGMYHSTENATFGLGMNFKKKYLVSGNYTTQTSALSNYTNGNFELNLRLKI